jgi:hypothetical protein
MRRQPSNTDVLGMLPLMLRLKVDQEQLSNAMCPGIGFR